MKFRVTFLIFFVLFSSTNGKVLIWDFGGIVFNPDKIGVAKHIGLKHFLLYMIMDMKSPNIQEDLFKFLDTIMPDDKKFGAVGTGDGVTLPTIMRHWQAGTILGPDIAKKANEHIKQMKAIGYFRSEYEAELMQKTINAMFNPKILAKNVYPLEGGVRLLKKCVAAKNSDGSKKNLNIGFSNWDPLSYKYFKKRYEDIFKLFDEVFISGDMKMVKPDKNAYKYIINKLNLKPEECLLIDDQDVNARGARKCKIGTLVLKSWDYEALEKQLKMYGAL